jgi:hypothetical protein
VVAEAGSNVSGACGGEGVTTASSGGLTLAVTTVPYVELGWGVLGGLSSTTIIEEVGVVAAGPVGGGAARLQGRRLGHGWMAGGSTWGRRGGVGGHTRMKHIGGRSTRKEGEGVA